MGGSWSDTDFERSALGIFEEILQYQPCILPDVGIDESLLKYSGPDSNAVLQAFSKEMLDTVPGYINSFGSSLGALNTVPNAVGIGAVVISMIIEIIIKGGTQTSADTYSLLRRVFGEEKASGVRDTMAEYLKRHRMFMHNDQRLREEIRRLEQQLSDQLTILRNSLLLDGQMSSRGFKIWVNGAAFHLQMLIHEARLEIQAGKPASDCVHHIKAAIDVYLVDLDLILEKYKTFKIKSEMFKTEWDWSYPYSKPHHYIRNNENKSCGRWYVDKFKPCPCMNPQVVTAFMDIVCSKYEPITGLKSYFLNMKNNLYSRIRERGSFTVPTAEGRLV